ncbi:MAG: hypothetical protein ABIU07_16295 [Ramlibacter sp.]
MLLVITGFVLLALGLFAGGALVAGALGAVPGAGGATLWVLFPVFSIAGYVLFVIGGRTSQVRGGSLLLSGLMIALALASAAGLVMEAAGVVQPAGSTLSLWYVMAVAGCIGVVGAASLGRSGAEA